MALADELIPFRAYTISRCQMEFRAEVEAVRSEAARREKLLLEQQRQVVAQVQAESQCRRYEENAHPNQHHKGRQTTKHTTPPPQKQNPFKTAKRQFVDEEDGDLSKIAKKGAVDAAGGGHYGAASGVLGGGCSGRGKGKDGEKDKERELPPELAHLDKALVEKIENDIVVRGQKVTFSDIAGLEFAKGCVQELICWPMSRPDIFTGLRALPKGLLLFGPPGTGKTLIGKAIAHEAGATFFSISSSSLTSKWIGEGEKMVRTLFAVAAFRQPAVVFIDEVDSLLCARNSDENEATRRLKTEFLVQLDGAGTDQSARVVIVGATNRPEELDEAARRRFVKRIYIPLPDAAGRAQLVNRLLGESDDGHALGGADVYDLVQRTAGFSGADISNLCQEAAMGPVREIAKRFKGDLKQIKSGDMQSIQMSHFTDALERVQPSVTTGDLERYLQWNATFGTYKEASHPLATSQDK
jgi:SpoVK/Ycf46/Vps4 family AAA+-type ATPase